MICKECGGKARVLSRDIVFGNYANVVYYCEDCGAQWEVIEIWVKLSEA